jgi:hypothetical protein
MQIKTTFLLALLTAFSLGTTIAQTTADLENLSVPAAGFLNNAAPNDAFQSGNVSLHNFYDAGFDFWDGWAISKVTDNTTPGFNNQYSAIAGKGYSNSANYAVGYAFSGNYIRLDGAAAGGVVNGLYVTNSTYAYYSMLEGDAFAKKFGGVTGNDPDFFKLTIKKYLNGQLSTDSVDFFLADYRFANNASDYLVKTWTYVDLRSLGNVDSLAFFLSSSDNGTFGMNTPAYFCLDHITTADAVTGTDFPTTGPSFAVFPNPASTAFSLMADTEGTVVVRDAIGRVVAQLQVFPGNNNIPCGTWARGVYFVQMGGIVRRIVVK